jgi:MraZ protein
MEIIMNALFGEEKCKVDGNGRCKFPTSFRKQMADFVADGFIIKESIHECCLELWPRKAFEQDLLEKTACLNDHNPNDRNIRRKLAEGCQIWLDSSDRFLIPLSQKKYGNIEETVTLKGAVNRIEIWSDNEKIKAEENINWSELIFKRLGDIPSNNSLTK